MVGSSAGALPAFSLAQIRSTTQARDAHERRADERAVALLLLVEAFLIDRGFAHTAAALAKECPRLHAPIATAAGHRIPVLADNLDLGLVVEDFEKYYELRYSKPIKLIRHAAAGAAAPGTAAHPAPAAPARPAAGAGGGMASSTSAPAAAARWPSGRPSEGALDAPPRSRLPPPLPIEQHAVTHLLRKVAGSLGVPPNAAAAASLAPGAAMSLAAPRPLPSIEPLGGAKLPAAALPGVGDIHVSGARLRDRGESVAAPGGTAATAASPDAPASHLLTAAAAAAAAAAAVPPAHAEAPAARLLKPITTLFDPELADLAAVIQRDIFVANPNVRWTDIAGLATPKQRLKEALVYPSRYPELFTGLLQPWRGILLFGPPGTGKTLLAKAVATECQTTFFNISASALVSKWRGDSEKLVRVLFELARHHAPSTIFIDEIESLMGARGGAGGMGGGRGGGGGGGGGGEVNEHEGSRRMKTEFLIQLDGLCAGTSQRPPVPTADGGADAPPASAPPPVFLLAATNLPWDLDAAFLRRMEKRILIDVPDAPAREAMLRRLLPADWTDGHGDPIVSAELDYAAAATQTEGYTGSDIRLVAKEAAMRPLREVLGQLERADADEKEVSASEPRPRRRGVNAADVAAALRETQASTTPAMRERHQQWSRDFGST